MAKSQGSFTALGLFYFIDIVEFKHDEKFISITPTLSIV